MLNIIELNSTDEIQDILDSKIRDFIIDCKYERLNFCFFKRNYKPSTTKQIDYIKNILDITFEYDLADNQYNYLRKLSMSEASNLITLLKSLSFVVKTDEPHITNKINIIGVNVRGFYL